MANNTVSAAAQQEQVQEQVTKSPILTYCYLLGVRKNKNGSKIAVSLLDPAGQYSNGHFDVAMVDSPVFTTWFDAQTASKEILDLQKKPVLSVVDCFIVGDADFKRLIKVLSDDEAAAIRKLRAAL